MQISSVCRQFTTLYELAFVVIDDHSWLIAKFTFAVKRQISFKKLSKLVVDISSRQRTEALSREGLLRHFEAPTEIKLQPWRHQQPVRGSAEFQACSARQMSHIWIWSECYQALRSQTARHMQGVHSNYSLKNALISIADLLWPYDPFSFCEYAGIWGRTLSLPLCFDLNDNLTSLPKVKYL